MIQKNRNNDKLRWRLKIQKGLISPSIFLRSTTSSWIKERCMDLNKMDTIEVEEEVEVVEAVTGKIIEKKLRDKKIREKSSIRKKHH